jgi:hypothetical protein
MIHSARRRFSLTVVLSRYAVKINHSFLPGKPSNPLPVPTRFRFRSASGSALPLLAIFLSAEYNEFHEIISIVPATEGSDKASG